MSSTEERLAQTKLLLNFNDHLSARAKLLAILALVPLVPLFRGGRDPLGFVVVAFSTILLTYLWYKQKSNHRPYLARREIGLVLGSVAWLVGSVLWAADRFAAALQGLVYVYALLLAVIVSSLYASEVFRLYWRKLMMLSVAAVAAWGVYLYVVSPFGRATSVFYWPNPYALYLIVGAFIGLYEYQRESRRWKRIVLALIIASVALTQSLAAFVFGFIGLAYALRATPIRHRRRHIKHIAALFTASAFLVLVIHVLKVHILNGVSLGTPVATQALVGAKGTSLGDRFAFWGAGWNMYIDHPVQGVGSGNFGVWHPQYQSGPEQFASDPHNFYVQILAETGGVGVLLFIGLVGMLAWRWWHAKKTAELHMVSAALLVFGLHLGFYQIFRYPALVYLFAVLLAYFMHLSSSRRSPLVVRWHAGLVVLTALTLSLPAVMYFRSETFAREGNAAFAEYGDFVEAKRLLELSNKQWFGNPDNLSAEAMQYFYESDYAQTHELLDAAIMRDSQDSTPYYVKGLAYKRARDQVQAAYFFEASLVRDRYNLIDTSVQYTNMLNNAGSIDRSRQLLDFILPLYDEPALKARTSGMPDLRRKVARLHFERARIAVTDGDIGRARIEASRSLELRPDYVPTLDLLRFVDESS